MMNNKKSWVKIVEAVIAILIVLSFVLLIFSRQNIESNRDEEISKILRSTLDYLSKDDSARNDVLVNNVSGINLKIVKIIPLWLNFSSNICDVSLACPNPAGFLKQTVYSDEILVFANLTYSSANATKLKIFLWEK